MAYRDPITGDMLTRAERVSWTIQGVVRRWTVLIVITVATVGIFVYAAVEAGAALGTGAKALLTWWNLWASWFAIALEATVGIAMFSMAKRTAVKLRHLCEIIDRLDHIIEHHPTIPTMGKDA